MLRDIKVGKTNPGGTNDRLPIRGTDGRYVNSTLEPKNDRDTFFATAYKKLRTLKTGEPDSKKKAKLFEIATNNLNWYFQKGGTLDAPVEIAVTDEKNKATKTVVMTARQLQQQLEEYQK